MKEYDPETEILFAGNPNGMESRIVPNAGYDFAPIKVLGIQRRISVRNIKNNIKALWYLAGSSARAKEIINENFAPSRMQSIIDGYVEICQEWVEKTYTRFNMSNVYADKLNIMRNFYKNRPEHALAYLDKFCGKQ